MRRLVSSDSAVLRTAAREVPEGEEIRPLALEMLAIMKAHNGVGLAAPQIGEDVRLVIGGHPRVNWAFALINPRIVKRSTQVFGSREACLSFPGKVALMKRSKLVVVEGFDIEWRPVRIKARALFAACLQHEIDHLEGVCILD